MELLDTVESILKQKKPVVRSVSPDATVYEALVLMAEKVGVTDWIRFCRCRWVRV